MLNIRLYQSSKYNTKRYSQVNFIYFRDNSDNSLCIPMLGDLESVDNIKEIVKQIAIKYNLKCSYYEKLIIDSSNILLMEFKGTMSDLVDATELIGKSVTLIDLGYGNCDIYIE